MNANMEILHILTQLCIHTYVTVGVCLPAATQEKVVNGSGVTWKISDADLGTIPQSSSFSIENVPDISSHSAPATAATK